MKEIKEKLILNPLFYRKGNKMETNRCVPNLHIAVSYQSLEEKQFSINLSIMWLKLKK